MTLTELVVSASRRAPQLGWTISCPGAGTSADPGRPGIEAFDVAVSGVSLDSRSVQAGELFFCVPGQETDGHDFARAAVGAGARALLVERELDIAVPQVKVTNVRTAMAHTSVAFNRNPSSELTVVGITGTNGKTTTAELIGEIASFAGLESSVIGTLTGSRTTPEAPELQGRLRSLADAGTSVVAMEVSSHALVQDRVLGTQFAVGVFTNLSPDHLDYHADMDDYFAAKASLFEAGRIETAVINVDDPWGARLAEMVQVPVTRVSRTDIELATADLEGSKFVWRGHEVDLALPGYFNLDNAIAAATACSAIGIADEDIAAGLSAAKAVPGRFEVVVGPVGQPFVVVDYSHTPDGIEKVLDSIRGVRPKAAVAIVFGCGGDRDRSKRPLMAAAAEAGADHVVVTSDNPRTEDPSSIIDEALAGMIAPANAVVEPDRKKAIAKAVGLLGPGDVVVVAGKGNEATQQIGDRVVPFDDREVSAAVLREAAR